MDVETTGLPPDAAVCQIGWTDVVLNDCIASVSKPYQLLINPHRKIACEATAVHHIRDKDVEGARDFPEIRAHILRAPVDAVCAHNAVFERNFIDAGTRPWVCTKKIAMRIWPDAPNFQNQTLRYYLGIDEAERFTAFFASPTHHAGPDSYVTAHILAAALERESFDQLIKWSNEPSLLPGAIQFGKHKGTPWSKVDPSYLDWLVYKAGDLDEDVKFTARHWLTRRRNDDR
jgi:exodeoxyribonuclease X